MKIEYRKKFLKELSKIHIKQRVRIESFVFKELPETNSIFELGNVEQMKGYPSYYKIRFGQYRIGLKLKDGIVILERVLHRKDIYRYFP
jgi:mRNA interferase RelE/StbE